MSVLLFILKLIGIILLVLLGVVLVALALVLIVPVRYQISGQVEDEITVHAKITWLLHAISYALDYQEGEVQSCLKILGIRKKSGTKSALDEEPDDIWQEEDENSHTDTEDAPIVEDHMTEDTVAEDEVDIVENTETIDEFEATVDDETYVEHTSSPFRRIVERIRTFFATIKAKIETFVEILHKIKRAIPQMLNKASSLKGIILDEMNQFVFRQVLAELKYLLGHFKFRKLVTDLRFATGDPATTGQALGVLCMLPMLYQYQVSIVPDFESEEFYIKGTFEIKGRMRGIHVVRSLLRLIKQKEVRNLLKKIAER